MRYFPIILVLTFSACSVNQLREVWDPTYNPRPTYSIRDLRLMKASPQDCRGKLLAFYGRILSVENDGQKSAVQLAVQDPENEFLSEPVAFVWNYKTNGVAESDYASIAGRCLGLLRGKNAFGAETAELTFTTVEIYDLTSGMVLRNPEEVAAYTAWESPHGAAKP